MRNQAFTGLQDTSYRIRMSEGKSWRSKRDLLVGDGPSFNCVLNSGIEACLIAGLPLVACCRDLKKRVQKRVCQ